VGVRSHVVIALAFGGWDVVQTAVQASGVVTSPHSAAAISTWSIPHQGPFSAQQWGKPSDRVSNLSRLRGRGLSFGGNLIEVALRKPGHATLTGPHDVVQPL
jgi:hypothetical protein